MEDYVIEVWSANEGLPSNNLRHIAKDPRGFLWISTFNGCVRFDGNKFKTFDTDNIPVISTSAFYSINAQKDGTMYLATQSSGLIKYKNGEFSKVFDTPNMPNAIQLTYQGRDRFWIASRNAGLYYIEDNEVKKYPIPEFADQSIMCFASQPDSTLWVASEGAGIVRISKEGYTLYTVKDGLASNIVNALTYHDGNVYAGTEQGLSVFTNGEWANDERLAGININDIVSDKQSNLWFATGVGLARISHPDTFEFIGEKEGLPSRQISSLIFDDEGSVWLTTKRGGLVQLKLSSFKNITQSEGLSYQGVNVVSEAPDGSFYVGSDNGEVDVVKDNHIERLKLRTELDNVSIKDIFVDDDGTIWIATYIGVIKKKGKSERLYTIEDGLLSLKTRRITKDKDGVIWVGSRNGGINKFYEDGRIESVTTDNGLGSDFIFSMDETPDGRMIVGTANGGLNIIETDGSIKIENPNQAITGLSIFNVYVENNSRMWLATNIGLYCYENGKFSLLGPGDGLVAETIFDVIEDSEGNLWSTSILGTTRLRKKDALDFIHNKLSKVEPTLFNSSDGMVTSECTGATQSLLSDNGIIWIPTIKGVSILDPANIVLNNKAPLVYIEDINVDDRIKEIIGSDSEAHITIEPGHRNYQFEYTSVSMYSPEKISFKYKLEGFDDDWIDAGSLRQAKYTNLPYGKYTFKVIAANNNGIWSNEQARLKVVIEPYFYETRTFVILIILAFVVLTVVIYMMQTSAVQGRNKELIKLNRELDSFTYSVSHDLKAPLTSIQGLLNVARLDDGNNALKYYERIEESVDKLDRFIKDIIDYSKNSRLAVRKEEVNVKSMIISMIEGLSYLIDGKKIKSIIDIDNDLIIETDKTRFVFILNNLLTNAFRYADLEKEEPFVKLSAYVEGNKLYLSIVDNGQGIRKEHQSKIFDMFYRANEGSEGSGLGLYIVKESVERLKGKIKLESEYGIGTSVNIVLPHVIH